MVPQRKLMPVLKLWINDIYEVTLHMGEKKITIIGLGLGEYIHRCQIVDVIRNTIGKPINVAKLQSARLSTP